MTFAENRVLFGPDETPRITAVELAGEREVLVWRRAGAGPDAATTCERAPFTPFLWLDEEADVTLPGDRRLAGGLRFDRLATLGSWSELGQLRADLRERGVAHFALTDPVQQYLTVTGRTLFKGMIYQELRRMQVDIETFCTPGYEFPSAERPGDHIMAIAVSDQSGWEELILVDRHDHARSERVALEQLNALIKERDPDVLEGHNFFKFDLPYLQTRARRHRVRLNWGRDDTPITSRASRIQIAEKTINYPKFEVRGRHIVDTFILAQLYDIGTRELEGFGLKAVAKHFNVAGGGGDFGSEARTYLHGLEIQETYLQDPQRFAAYALDDVRETRAISGLLGNSYFIQTQIFPYNYQEVIIRGNATRVNSLFLREYYQRDHSIPDLPTARAYEGGYTDVFVTGVKRNVWHCDVASLYPSVMLRYDVFPKADKLGIFRGLLTDLRKFRLDAKAALRKVTGDPVKRLEYNTLNALQNVFKVLINSFYGYLGFAQGHFADYDAAARVTETGRDLLKAMVARLREAGAEVIEIDTDGIYFVPPEGTTGTEDLQKTLAEVLPQGIEIEFDAKFEAMFSYKAKNYALLDTKGHLILKGGAFKSRGLERFQRVFMGESIRLLLEGKPEEIGALRDEFERKIRHHEWDIEWLLKNDTLQDSLDAYSKKISASARNRSAAYELAIKSGRKYQPGDQIRYYITGDKRKVSGYENAKLATEFRPDQRDENVEYYVGKLNELVGKYAEFVEIKIPPAPRASDANQGDLFGALP